MISVKQAIQDAFNSGVDEALIIERGAEFDWVISPDADECEIDEVGNIISVGDARVVRLWKRQ